MRGKGVIFTMSIVVLGLVLFTFAVIYSSVAKGYNANKKLREIERAQNPVSAKKTKGLERACTQPEQDNDCQDIVVHCRNQ